MLEESVADIKSRTVAAWDHAAEVPEITLLIPSPRGVPRGFGAWRVGDSEPFSIAVLPMLARDAPPGVIQRYRSRILAVALGTCWLCGQTATLSADPEHSPVGWSVLPISIGISHLPGCPAEFTDDDKQWFPIFASGDAQ